MPDIKPPLHAIDALTRLLQQRDVRSAEMFLANAAEALQVLQAGSGNEALRVLDALIGEGDVAGIRTWVEQICLRNRVERLRRLGVEEPEEAAALRWHTEPHEDDRRHQAVQLARDVFHQVLAEHIGNYMDQAWAVMDSRAPLPWPALCPGCHDVMSAGGSCPKCGRVTASSALVAGLLYEGLTVVATQFFRIALVRLDGEHGQLAVPPRDGVGRSVPVSTLAQRRGPAGSNRGVAPDPATRWLWYCLDATLTRLESHAPMGWSREERSAVLDVAEQLAEKVFTEAIQKGSRDQAVVHEAMASWVPQPRDAGTVQRAVARARRAVDGDE